MHVPSEKRNLKAETDYLEMPDLRKIKTYLQTNEHLAKNLHLTESQ